MNRRGFLKAFAGTSVAAVAAPMLLLEGSAIAPVALADHYHGSRSIADSELTYWWPLDDAAAAAGPSVEWRAQMRHYRSSSIEWFA